MKFNINGKSIEVADDLISKAIEDKTEAMDVTSDLVIRTATEEDQFVTNTKEHGNHAAFEIGRKQVLKGLGIEVDGQHKSDESAIKAINTFVQGQVATALTDAKIAPDKKVSELEADKKTLVNNMSTLQGQFDTFKSETVVKEQNQTRRNTLSGLVPDNVVNRNDALDIMSIRMKTEFNDKGVMHGIGADGEAMKDPTTLALLPMDKVVGAFFADNQSLLKTAGGGAAGDDSAGGGGGKQSFNDFIKEQKEAGNAVNSPAFVAAMGDKMKAGTLEEA